jgi:phosphotriesterase-related protein
MTRSVETVRGPVELDRLGRTLMHEHIFVLDPEAFTNFGHAWGESYWDEERGLADAAEKIRAVRAAGIETIVDPTVIGIGRDIRRIKRLAEQVDVNIIVAAGIFAFMEMRQFWRYRTAQGLAELFVREIREGIDDTGVKAAFLKCAVEEYGLLGDVPKLLEAIALASLETGVPIMVHTNAAEKTGPLALEAFAREGVDPTRIVLAHSGDTDDLDYLRSLADRGAALGFDRFGGEHRITDRQRIETVAALVDEGYTDRIHISHDASCFLDFPIGDVQWSGLLLDYMHVPTTILPALLAAGVTQEQIDEMMIENPKRFFG